MMIERMDVPSSHPSSSPGERPLPPPENTQLENTIDTWLGSISSSSSDGDLTSNSDMMEKDLLGGGCGGGAIDRIINKEADLMSLITGGTGSGFSDGDDDSQSPPRSIPSSKDVVAAIEWSKTTGKEHLKLLKMMKKVINVHAES